MSIPRSKDRKCATNIFYRVFALNFVRRGRRPRRPANVQRIFSSCVCTAYCKAPSERELSSECETEGECANNNVTSHITFAQAPSVFASQIHLPLGGRLTFVCAIPLCAAVCDWFFGSSRAPTPTIVFGLRNPLRAVGNYCFCGQSRTPVPTM